MSEMRLRIEDNEDLVAARAAALENGVAATEVAGEPSGGLDQQIEPVTAVLIGAGVVAGVKVVIDWWSRRRGGLIVDMRSTASAMFYRDKNVEFGYVLFIPADGGQVTVEVKDVPDAATKWISEVISGSLKTVSAVADAAKTMVGSDRVVEVTSP